jgi:hypothetical protein
MNQTQLTALHAEVTGDPLHLGYAACLPDSPGHIADILNAPTQTMLHAISESTALEWAATGPYAHIVDAGATIGHPCRASCLVVRDAMLAGLDVHLESVSILAMFAGWVAAGVLTEAQHTALLTLATHPASRAEVLGFGFVFEADLREAGAI